MGRLIPADEVERLLAELTTAGSRNVSMNTTRQAHSHFSPTRHPDLRRSRRGQEPRGNRMRARPGSGTDGVRRRTMVVVDCRRGASPNRNRDSMVVGNRAAADIPVVVKPQLLHD